MNKLVVESWALVLLLAAFPLTSIGSSGGAAPVWWLGFASLIVGSLLPVLTRFADRKNVPDEPGDIGMEFDERTS